MDLKFCQGRKHPEEHSNIGVGTLVQAVGVLLGLAALIGTFLSCITSVVWVCLTSTLLFDGKFLPVTWLRRGLVGPQ